MAGTVVSIRDLVRSFVLETFLFGADDAGLGDADSFVDTGVIDSTGIMELVAFVESEFGIELSESELSPDNLDSISNIEQFVNAKRRESNSARHAQTA